MAATSKGNDTESGGTIMTKLAHLVALAATAVAFLLGAGPAMAGICADLANLDLPDTRITVAERVTSGSFGVPYGGPGAASGTLGLEVPAMCRVAGVVAPAINFEVWMPEGEGWNGRFQAVGGGGLAGVVSYAAMGRAVRGGFATASTDTGHEAGDMTWLSDLQRSEDYGYRAIHEMTLKAKTIIDAYYGKGPQYSYFNGCSTGGRQGLMEAQRFPDDFDGIVSGAPVNFFTHLHMGQLWTAHATLKTPGAAMTPADFALVSEAVLGRCDAEDGVEDGILTDPRRCDFDPAVLQCQAGEGEGCLSAPQVEALKMIYRGTVNPRTGAQIYPGLEPGGEGPQPNNPGWAMIMDGEKPFFIDSAILGGMAFENPDWDWRSFDFDQDVDLVDAKLYRILNAVSPDLREFKGHGGKLIIYHGWNDPGVMPQQTVDYYQSLIDFAEKATGADGEAFTEDYARLYMMPGMGHCRGGSGPDQANFMQAVVDWVEQGDAPAGLTSWKEMQGEVTMSRPICPYPQRAEYKGRGATDQARNFECALPE